MLLYNVIFGNQNTAPSKWSHIIDDYNNHFLAKDDIHQRIRIDKGIDPEIYPDLGELEPAWSSANVQCYNVFPDTVWVNNNKNMNPILFSNKSKNPSETIVLFISIATNYEILRFTTAHRILQTYHKKDLYQGCAVVLNVNDRDANPEFINIKMHDRKKDLYIDVKVVALEKEPEKIIIEKKQIKDNKLIAKFKEQLNRYKNKFMGFKIVPKPGDFLTCTYFVNIDDGEEYLDSITEAVKHVKNHNIYSVSVSRLNSDPEYADDFEEDIKQLIENDRIKAVTLCDVKLPIDMIRRLRLLYIFNYIENEDGTAKLICKKSN